MRSDVLEFFGTLLFFIKERTNSIPKKAQEDLITCLRM